jgi:hypothetical protein
MPTRSVTLTTVPQSITVKAAFLESQGGDFHFAFNSTLPTDLNLCHKNHSVYVDGSLGTLWAWKSSTSAVKLIISEAV